MSENHADRSSPLERSCRGTRSPRRGMEYKSQVSRATRTLPLLPFRPRFPAKILFLSAVLPSSIPLQPFMPPFQYPLSKMRHLDDPRCASQAEGKRPVHFVWGTGRLLLLGGGLSLEDSLDDVGLLDQEGSGDPRRAISTLVFHENFRNSPALDTGSTPRTTVSSRNGLLSLGDGGVGSGSKSGHTGEGEATVTTLGGGLRGEQRISMFALFATANEDVRRVSSSGAR